MPMTSTALVLASVPDRMLSVHRRQIDLDAEYQHILLDQATNKLADRGLPPMIKSYYDYAIVLTHQLVHLHAQRSHAVLDVQVAQATYDGSAFALAVYVVSGADEQIHIVLDELAALAHVVNFKGFFGSSQFAPFTNGVANDWVVVEIIEVTGTVVVG